MDMTYQKQVCPQCIYPLSQRLQCYGSEDRNLHIQALQYSNEWFLWSNDVRVAIKPESSVVFFRFRSRCTCHDECLQLSNTSNTAVLHLVSGDPHLCQIDCHSGPCPVCPQTTMVKCRCGNMDREISCQDLTTKADDARCEKKCTKVWICIHSFYFVHKITFGDAASRYRTNKQTLWPLVRELTIPTDRPPLVDEI
jgi:hypothetical protein